MLSIYHYTEAHSFLKDAWESKKTRNPAFSMRAWSKKLGFENNSPLSLMLAGKRPIPRKYLPQIAEDLELDPQATRYLELLVDLRSAKSDKQKEYYLDRLRQLSPKEPIRMIELEHFKVLGDPIHMAILEMTELKGFDPCPRSIQKNLRFESSVKQISEAIERLIIIGLLKEKDGKLVKNQKHVTNKADIVDKGTQAYHKNVCKLASDQIDKQTVDEKEYNGYAMNIPREKLPLAKKLIRNFTKDFINQIEAEPKEAVDTYQLNVQFFGLARLENSKE